MVEIRQTCPVAPVQYEGKVDWYKLYFRAREAGWSLSILAGDGAYIRSAGYGNPGGLEASAMDDRVAQDFIERCLAEYLSGARGEFIGEPPLLPPEQPALLDWDEKTRTGRSRSRARARGAG